MIVISLSVVVTIHVTGSAHPQKTPWRGMEAFEPSFGYPYHFTQLHAGLFVAA